MFLGIQWLGWIILVLTYVPVAAVLVWIAHKRGVRSTAFGITAALTALPFAAAIAEAAWVEHNWRALCATATTEIKRQVVVEGFYDDGFRDDGWDILRNGKDGFRFIEWKDKHGRFLRSEGFAEPKLRTMQIDKPAARYHWRMPQFSTPISHLIKRRVETIVDSQSEEVIARKVTGYRYPAFIDRLWWQWFGSPPYRCEKKGGIWYETLIGIDRKE